MRDEYVLIPANIVGGTLASDNSRYIFTVIGYDLPESNDVWIDCFSEPGTELEGLLLRTGEPSSAVNYCGINRRRIVGHQGFKRGIPSMTRIRHRHRSTTTS